MFSCCSIRSVINIFDSANLKDISKKENVASGTVSATVGKTVNVNSEALTDKIGRKNLDQKPRFKDLI